MNKLEQLEAQLKEMQKQIEEMKNAPSQKGYSSPWALSCTGEDGHCLDVYLNRQINGYERGDEDDYNAFKEEHAAQGFANAFHVMIALRQCEGAGEVSEEGKGWFMSSAEMFSWGNPTYDSYFCYYTLVPPFPSKALLNKAIESVGKEKILQAYEFLATGKSNA